MARLLLRISHYALFPHFNVRDNIGYGLRQRTPPHRKAEISKQVAETLEIVRLSGYEDRRIWELSGGQQQRVALARALINFLLDPRINAKEVLAHGSPVADSCVNNLLPKGLLEDPILYPVGRLPRRKSFRRWWRASY